VYTITVRQQSGTNFENCLGIVGMLHAGGFGNWGYEEILWDY